jgi:hypothetical protein
MHRLRTLAVAAFMPSGAVAQVDLTGGNVLFTGSAGMGLTQFDTGPASQTLLSVDGSTGSGPVRGGASLLVTISSLGSNAFGESFALRATGFVEAVIESGSEGQVNVSVQTMNSLFEPTPLQFALGGAAYRADIADLSTVTPGGNLPTFSPLDAANAAIMTGDVLMPQTMTLGFFCGVFLFTGSPAEMNQLNRVQVDYSISFIAVPGAPTAGLLAAAGALAWGRRRREF